MSGCLKTRPHGSRYKEPLSHEGGSLPLMSDLFLHSIASSGKTNVVGIESLFSTLIVLIGGMDCEKPALWLRCVWMMVW